MEATKQRDNSFDVLKGILILFVLIGHAYQYQYQCWHTPVFNFIYTFHMPLFIFVSGYFLFSSSRREFRPFVTNKAKRLLLPCLIWSTVMFLFFIFSEEFRSLDIFSDGVTLKTVYHLVYKIYSVFTLDWFLICVFVLSLAYYPFCKFLMRKNVIGGGKYLRISAIIVAIWIVGLICFDKIPYFLLKNCQITRQFLIFGLGVLYSQFHEKMKSYIKVIVCFFLLCVIALDRYYHGRWIGDYDNYLRIVDGVACGLVAFTILKPFSNWLAKNSVGSIFVYLGKNSLGIYVIHMVFTRIIKWYELFEHYPNDIMCLLLTLAFLLFSILIMEFLKRVFKNHEIFGI